MKIVLGIIILTRCPNVLNDMSVPISSPIAIRAIPSTATAVAQNNTTFTDGCYIKMTIGAIS